MKKIITLAISLSALTFTVKAQSNIQKDTNAKPQPAEITTNPLFTPNSGSGVNPIVADVKPASPLYSSGSTETVNPLYQSNAKVTGQPIGGIVVKGGQNGLEITAGNPIPGVGVVVKHNIIDEQKTMQPSTSASNGKGISEKGIK